MTDRVDQPDPGGTEVVEKAEGSGVAMEIDAVDGGARGKAVGNRRVFGGPGRKYCLLCRCRRDHMAAACPGDVCWTCDERGHHAGECKIKVCGWCEGKGHTSNECSNGGKVHFDKRKSLAIGSSASSVRGAASYASTVRGKPISIRDRFLGMLDESEVSYGRKMTVIERRFQEETDRHEAALEREYALHRERMDVIEGEQREAERERKDVEVLRLAAANLFGSPPPPKQPGGLPASARGTEAAGEESGESSGGVASATGGIASAIPTSASAVVGFVVGVEGEAMEGEDDEIDLGDEKLLD